MIPRRWIGCGFLMWRGSGENDGRTRKALDIHGRSEKARRLAYDGQPLGRRGFEPWPLGQEAKRALEQLTLGRKVRKKYLACKAAGEPFWLDEGNQ